MKSIQSLSTSFIVAFGLAIVSGATLAQIQGPAAPNYQLGQPAIRRGNRRYVEHQAGAAEKSKRRPRDAL